LTFRTVLQSTDVEYIITWVAFPLSIILLIIGRFAAKYENRPAMVGFLGRYIIIS